MGVAACSLSKEMRPDAAAFLPAAKDHDIIAVGLGKHRIHAHHRREHEAEGERGKKPPHKK